MSRWLHSLQQFQFSIIHRPGKDHGNADGLSRAPSSPCRQCTRPDCPPATLIHCDADQPFNSVSTGSSEDADLVPVQSGKDWIARLDDDLSRPVEVSGDLFHISALQVHLMVHCGGKEAPRAPSCSYWCQRLAESDFSCRIMHLCTEVIWDGRGRWRGWQIVSIGRGWRMT